MTNEIAPTKIETIHLIAPTKIQTIHLSRNFCKRDNLDKGGITIAFKVEPVTITGHLYAVVKGAMATCNEKDAFVKSIGRNLATERLQKFIETSIEDQNCGISIVGKVLFEHAGFENLGKGHVPIFSKSRFEIVCDHFDVSTFLFNNV